MKLFESFKEAFRGPARSRIADSEKTQEFTPEDLAKLGHKDEVGQMKPPKLVGMQHFGYRRSDGMDSFYLNKEEQKEADLKAARERVRNAGK